MKGKKVKANLTRLAVLGLASGCLIGCQKPDGTNSGQGNGTGGNNSSNNGKANGNNTSMNHNMSMSKQETDFANKLNRDGKQAFESMNPDERSMAMRTVEAGCKGKNMCKGLGGCKTNVNECAGKNMCKGLGGCKVTDPNKAVMLVEKASQNGSMNQQNGNGNNNQR